MSLGKRKANAPIDQFDKNKNTKKSKIDGPDIPSSNFVPLSSKPVSKQIKPSFVTSVVTKSIPPVSIKSADPAKLLQKIALPEKYREVLGPNIEELKKWEMKKKKEQKLAEIQAKAERAANPIEIKKPEPEPIEEKPKMVTLDEAGRMRDEQGNILNIKPTSISSLKININRAKEERIKEMFRTFKGIGIKKDMKFYDSNLVSKTALDQKEKKKTHAFHFIEKGTIVRKAEAIRKKNGVGIELNENQDYSGISAGSKRISVKVRHHDPIPDIEWWDTPILVATRKSFVPKDESEQQPIEDGKDSGTIVVGVGVGGIGVGGIGVGGVGGARAPETVDIEKLKKNVEMLNGIIIDETYLNLDKINRYIEHPVPFRNNLTGQNIVLPMYFTKEERRKLRRQKRQEKEKEKQDKIKLGLMKPPPPKLKLSNFMRVIGDEAIADPTRVEQEVRKQIADRLQAHLERNAKKKLTKEQKAEKILRKLKRDSALECRVCVFRIEDLSNRRHKFKIDKNAQQLVLNGICIIVDKKSGLNLPSVVIVEGGPYATKFYKKLMLRRIKWEQMMEKKTKNENNEEEKIQPINPGNKCSLIWEGVTKDHNFNKWRVIEIKSELDGRRALAERGVEHYWDMALTGPAIEQNI